MTLLPNVRVRRTAWRDLRQDALPAYCENVVAQTTGKAAYDPIRTSLENLATKTATFNQSLADAINRGRQAVAYKDVVKKELYSVLDTVANGLESNANGDELYIINAGMEVRRAPRKHTGELLPVTKVTAKSTGLPGQVILQFRCPKQQRKQVETFAVEWSEDHFVTWTNGTYQNSQRIMMEGLPPKKEVAFRIRCLGTRGRKSPWSDGQVMAFVF